LAAWCYPGYTAQPRHMTSRSTLLGRQSVLLKDNARAFLCVGVCLSLESRMFGLCEKEHVCIELRWQYTD